MAHITQFNDSHQREFSKLYSSLCSKHGKWEVWSDFVMMSAISISNAVDRQHMEDRQNKFCQIEKKYSKEEMERLAGMFTVTVNALADKPDQDFLGDLFMALGLSNEHNGQFFSPYHICHFMALVTYGDDMTSKVEKDGWVSIHEPACGSGAMLIAFANVCRKKGLNYQTSVLFIAQDIDTVAGCISYIQMSLLGCPGYVKIGDSLASPIMSVDSRGLLPIPDENIWYTPLYFLEEWDIRRKICWFGMILDAIGKPKTSPPEAVEVESTIELRTTETGQLSLL